MQKYMFGKKINVLSKDEGCLEFKSKRNFVNFYNQLESVAKVINFRGECQNSNAFCKNEKYTFNPHFDTLTIWIRSVEL